MMPHIRKSQTLGLWFCCQYRDRERTWVQLWAMGATPAEAYRNYMRRTGHK